MCKGKHVRRQRRDAGSASSLTLKPFVLVPGSRLLPDIRPGARIPTPGVVTSGRRDARYRRAPRQRYGRPSHRIALARTRSTVSGPPARRRTNSRERRHRDSTTRKISTGLLVILIKDGRSGLWTQLSSNENVGIVMCSFVKKKDTESVGTGLKHYMMNIRVKVINISTIS